MFRRRASSARSTMEAAHASDKTSCFPLFFFDASFDARVARCSCSPTRTMAAGPSATTRRDRRQKKMLQVVDMQKNAY
jgi:hypothetical protein